MTEMKSELPPCPFCGSKNASADCSAESRRTSWEVGCGTCQAYTWGETEADAVAAWCRRSVPSEKSLGELLEAKLGDKLDAAERRIQSTPQELDDEDACDPGMVHAILSQEDDRL